MFPQGGNVTDISNFPFPSSFQNTETRYFVLWWYIRSKFKTSHTSCRPIRSVVIRAINKIERPRSGSLISLSIIHGLITSMITDRIGRHEVLLPINHNFNKICDIIGSFLNQNTRNSKFCFASSEKKEPFKRARDRDGEYCVTKCCIWDIQSVLCSFYSSLH